MKKQKSHIAKQFQLIKLTKTLVVCLLGLSFVLEFVMLNFISACKEQKVIVTVSYDQVTGDLIAVTDTIGTTVSQEYQEFIDYIKKKHEEKNRNTTENHQFTAFNLFFVDKFAFQFKNGFCLGKQGLNAFYQEPFTQKALSEIFHPPKV
ncbi:hypothetical protein [Eisenibacter elegans]|uniref:hypothetical protein n=1 Tax=Eisenibacter elegans TaxID=997 RepID=UPI000414A1E7|nr:hypothetical protein [Eisenibacter elegans]